MEFPLRTLTLTPKPHHSFFSFLSFLLLTHHFYLNRMTGQLHDNLRIFSLFLSHVVVSFLARYFINDAQIS